MYVQVCHFHLIIDIILVLYSWYVTGDILYTLLLGDIFFKRSNLNIKSKDTCIVWLKQIYKYKIYVWIYISWKRNLKKKFSKQNLNGADSFFFLLQCNHTKAANLKAISLVKVYLEKIYFAIVGVRWKKNC